MQWALGDTTHASWAFLYAAPRQGRGAYPLKFSGEQMYLSATVDPVPIVHIPSTIVTDAIDNFVEDDVRPTSLVEVQPLVFPTSMFRRFSGNAIQKGMLPQTAQ